MLNIGRLRLAAKGVDRRPAVEAGGKGELYRVDAEAQRDKGMFMIGQVATLRHRVLSMAELHDQVTAGGSEALARLAARPLPWQTERTRPKRHEHDIAIVGIGCMFPESADVREYWQNIVRGFNAIREVPASRWRPEDFYSADRMATDKVNSKWGAFLGDVIFNPLKYVIPPASLASIEPVQLLALEVAWQALEDAGYHSDEFTGERTAVIFGVSPMHDRGAEYAFRTLIRQYMPRVEWLSADEQERIIDNLDQHLPVWTEDSFAGYLPNVIAGRVSNRMNLRGANFAVDAACAASLAALHAAALELRTHSCDVAVAGAADGTNESLRLHELCQDARPDVQRAAPPVRRSCRRNRLGRRGGGAGPQAAGRCQARRRPDLRRDQRHRHFQRRPQSQSHRSPIPRVRSAPLSGPTKTPGSIPKPSRWSKPHGTGTAVGDRIEIQALQSVFSSHGSGRPKLRHRQRQVDDRPHQNRRRHGQLDQDRC